LSRFKLSTDRPLASSTHDVLGTQAFAKQLASALLSFRQMESLVVGLFGPWGSGKSTIINFLTEHLENQADTDKPIIFSFNPWLFSTHEDLVQLFLHELGVVLKQKDFSKVAEALENFSDALTEGLNTFQIPIIAPLCKGFISLFSSKWKKSLNDKKEAANKALLKSNKKIIVILDDVDRLTPEEIRLVFKLIKAICDFSNIIYIVSFDKQVVVDALNKFHNSKGEEYLEKIIQVPFEIPALDQSSINKLFFDKLDQILNFSPFSNNDEQFYWSQIFHYGIEPYLQNPRDVLRLANAFSLSFELVRGEVHWVDFLAVETLKVFNRNLYEELKHNKFKFSGLLEDSLSTNQQPTQEYFDSLFNQHGGVDTEKTKELLRILFPKIDCVLRQNMRYRHSFSTQWRRQLRVCSEDIFDTYFRLNFPEDSIRAAELERLAAASNNAQDFSKALIEIVNIQNSKFKTDKLLDRLLDYCETAIPIVHISYVVSAFMISGDELLNSVNPSDRGLLDIDTRIRIGRIHYHLLKRIESKDSIYRILYEAIQQGTALACIISEIAAVTSRSRREQSYFPTEEQELSDTQAQSLRTLGLAKIRQYKDEQKLLSTPDLLYILYRWKEWTDNIQEITDWIRSLVPNNLEFSNFLAGIISYSKSQGSGGVKTKFYIRYKTLADFIEPDALRGNIEQLVQNNLLANKPDVLRAIESLLREIDNPTLREREYFLDD
jgi:predicted KAP-like P-loop ATPase